MLTLVHRWQGDLQLCATVCCVLKDKGLSLDPFFVARVTKAYLGKQLNARPADGRDRTLTVRVPLLQICSADSIYTPPLPVSTSIARPPHCEASLRYVPSRSALALRSWRSRDESVALTVVVTAEHRGLPRCVWPLPEGAGSTAVRLLLALQADHHSVLHLVRSRPFATEDGSLSSRRCTDRHRHLPSHILSRPQPPRNPVAHPLVHVLWPRCSPGLHARIYCRCVVAYALAVRRVVLALNARHRDALATVVVGRGRR